MSLDVLLLLAYSLALLVATAGILFVTMENLDSASMELAEQAARERWLRERVSLLRAIPTKSAV